MFKKLLYTAIGLSLVLSCREDEEVINTPPVVVDSTLTVDLSGYVQKGPFINGTAITVSELDKKLVTTGKNFTTQIADNKGSFSLKGIKLKSNFVQLQADGFYFDEVKGEKSAAQLTLFALSDVEDVSSINANLLSHMERTRVIYLMQEEEKTFAEAKQQAQQEILAIFGIAREEMQKSELLDISQNGEDNAILLAISAVLQANNSVAELSELVANLITDLREDGVLSSQSNKDKIREQGKVLNLPQIRLNLEKRYEELGVNATIPNFEQYIDSDGDGILNKDEDDNPDDFTFTLQKDVAINTKVTSNAVKISGLKEGGTANAAVKGGKIILNGQVSSDSVVQMKNGDALQLQLASSQTYADTVKATLSIGTVVKHFQVITDDYVPDAFSFVAQKDVAVDSVYTSNMITVSGIPHPTPLTIEGGKVIKNGEELITDTTSVKNGDKLAVKLLSSSGFASATSATIDINGVTASFTITTDDYVPDDFNFIPIENAKVDSLYASNTVTISGLPFPAPVSIEGGQLIKNGKESSADKIILVQNGDQLAVKLSSSSEFISSKTATVNINGIKASFKITTDDYAPDKFDFIPVVNIQPNSIISSDTIVVNGLKYPTPVEIEGGSLFINGVKASNTGYLVKDGDQINIELLSSSFFYATTSSMLSIGSKSIEFKVTTYQNPWKKVSYYPGSATADIAGFHLNDKLYIGTGRNNSDSKKFKEFFEYNPMQNVWTKIADFGGLARDKAISFSVQNAGYVGIGIDDLSSPYSDVWKYEAIIDTWTKIDDIPEGNIRARGYGFSITEKAYVVINRKLWELMDDQWTLKGDLSLGYSHAPRYLFNIGSKAYFKYEFETNLWEYNSTINSWSSINNSNELDIGFTLNEITYAKGKAGWFKYDINANSWEMVEGRISSGPIVMCFSVNGKGYCLTQTSSFDIIELWEFSPPQE